MHRYQAEGQLYEFDDNEFDLTDDEFSDDEFSEFSAGIQQLYGDSLEDIAHQLDAYRNA